MPADPFAPLHAAYKKALIEVRREAAALLRCKADPVPMELLEREVDLDVLLQSVRL